MAPKKKAAAKKKSAPKKKAAVKKAAKKTATKRKYKTRMKTGEMDEDILNTELTRQAWEDEISIGTAPDESEE